MTNPDHDIAKFEAANRNRNRLIKAVVILVPVSIFAVIGKDCYTQESKRRTHNREVRADYKAEQEAREAREQSALDRRRTRLAAAREELDAMFAEASPLREAARAARRRRAPLGHSG